MIIPIGDQPNPRDFTPWVNYALLAVNVLVFLVVTLPLSGRAPDPNDPATRAYIEALLRSNPNVDPYLLMQQALRQLSAYDVFLMQWGYRPAAPSVLTLFSSMFLHGGWLHLLGNMLFLWIYGDNVEHRLGRLGYLAAYLATGVAAALGFGLFAPAATANVPMVGASGAISGVLGFYFLWFPRNKVRLLVFAFFFVFVWHVGARLVLGFYVLVENLLPFLFARSDSGVAYGAHIGGFVAGLAAAFVIDRWVAWRCQRRVKGCGGDTRQARPKASSDAQAVIDAHSRSDFATAAMTYVELAARDRRQVPARLVADLAEWLGASDPDASLALYGQALSDHPADPERGRLFLGIGLVLLHGKGRPTAAYQYLLDALDSDPDASTAARAREALTAIEKQQKYQLRSRRFW